MNCQLAFIAALFVFLQPMEPPLPATVSLGGPRRIEAVINRNGKDWEVQVRMIPVRTFDAATNAKLNREKARQYALQAMAKLLVKSSSSRLEVSGAQVSDVQVKGETFILTLRVPFKHVRVSTVPKTSDENSNEQVAFSSALFTRKSDLSKNLALVAEFLMMEADNLVKHPHEQVFPTALAGLKTKGIDAYQAIGAEVRSEGLLLQIEKDELLAAVTGRQKQFIETLKIIVAQREAMRQFSDLSIDKPFDGYLFNNPLLMETTGAKIIQLSNKSKVVLAVASTVLKDDSTSERLRAERVCRVKALASIVGEEQGVKIYRLEKDEERIKVKVENGKETARSVSDFLQITQSKVEGVTQGMPVIGRWRSIKGDVYYLAIGTIVNANDQSEHP